MMSKRRRSTSYRPSPKFVAGLAFVVAMFAVASLAAAHVVQVTTTIDIADVKSPHDFEHALQAAVDDAANEAIGFDPTIVALTSMRVVGDQVVVGILFADEDGKQMLEGLASGGNGSEEPDEENPVQQTKIDI